MGQLVTADKKVTGRLRLNRQHRNRHSRLRVAILANRELLCLNRLNPRVTHGYGIQTHRVVGDFNLCAIERGADFILPSFQTKAAALVHVAHDMVQKGLRDNGGSCA